MHTESGCSVSFTHPQTIWWRRLHSAILWYVTACCCFPYDDTTAKLFCARSLTPIIVVDEVLSIKFYALCCANTEHFVRVQRRSRVKWCEYAHTYYCRRYIMCVPLISTLKNEKKSRREFGTTAQYLAPRHTLFWKEKKKKNNTQHDTRHSQQIRKYVSQPNYFT